jgi:hypothetical protein
MNLLHNSNHLNNQTILAFKTYLLVWLAPEMITLCNYDPGTNEIISLKSFNYTKDELSNMDTLIPEVHSLIMNYRKKILIYSGQRFTLVPEQFLENHELIEKYFNINFAKEDRETLHKDYVEPLKAFNVFGIEEAAQKLIGHIDFDIIIHSISTYLKSIITSLNISEANSIYIDIQNSYFTVTLFQYGILQLCNSFPYKTSEDILYHIINISKHFNLDSEKETYHFSGILYQDSPLFNLLYKYIRQPELVIRPSGLNYHSSLSTIPQHFYYNVFALATCVS